MDYISTVSLAETVPGMLYWSTHNNIRVAAVSRYTHIYKYSIFLPREHLLYPIPIYLSKDNTFHIILKEHLRFEARNVLSTDLWVKATVSYRCNIFSEGHIELQNVIDYIETSANRGELSKSIVLSL